VIKRVGLTLCALVLFAIPSVGQSLIGIYAETSQAAKSTIKAKTSVTPAGGHSVLLTCTPPASGGTVTGYFFLRSTTSGGPYSSVNSTAVASCSTTDTTNLVEGTTYFYVVQATGPGGTSANSNQATAPIPFLPPGVPSGLSAVPQ